MRCIALERGHDGVGVREPGEEFDVSDSRIGADGWPADGATWYRAVEAEPDAPKPPRSHHKKT